MSVPSNTPQREAQVRRTLQMSKLRLSKVNSPAHGPGQGRSLEGMGRAVVAPNMSPFWTLAQATALLCQIHPHASLCPVDDLEQGQCWSHYLAYWRGWAPLQWNPWVTTVVTIGQGNMVPRCLELSPGLSQ